MPLLEIENLSVAFPLPTATGRAVDGVSIAVAKGESLGVVGESGSGKSLTMLAVMGLVPYPGQVTVDRLRFKDRDLIGMSGRERRRLAGKSMAMIFQDPMKSLNP
jgi:dipeptide transport system ATP-binding protein